MFLIKGLLKDSRIKKVGQHRLQDLQNYENKKGVKI